jgi:YD repeat-containing protein
VTDPRADEPDPRPHETVLAYDSVSGRLDQRRNRTSEQTTFSYDVGNRVTTVTKPLSRLTTYGYDADGKPVRITNPKNETTKLIWSRDRHVTGERGVAGGAERPA